MTRVNPGVTKRTGSEPGFSVIAFYVTRSSQSHYAKSE